MKKIISYLIALMMVFAMMPYTAFAEAAENQDLTVSYTYVNPEYADVISEDDLAAGEPAATFSRSITYASTPEEAAEVVREYVLNRVDSFTLYYKYPAADTTNSSWFGDLCDEIFSTVFEHTGTPTLGDYIYYSYGGYSIPSTSISSDGTYYYMPLPVNITYYTTLEQEEEMDAAVESLMSEIITDGMSDYEKIEAIYDYMTSNIAYDYDNLNDSTYKLKYTAYAALINKTAVCQGYAGLFYRLALEAGVDARVITGTAGGGGHAWNIAKIGTKYYLADATWDTSYYATYSSYNYFLKSAFSDHETDAEFLTSEFTAAYPVSSSDYVPCTTHTAETIPAVAATCTASGLTAGSECTACGKILTAQEEVPALGHDLTSHDDKAATCTEIGWDAYETCSRCDYTTYEEIAALGHKEEIIPAVAATCTAKGLTAGSKCTVCGEILTAQEEVAPLGHDKVSHAAKESTCTESGWYAYETCSRCDYSTYMEMPATGIHTSVTSTVKATTAKAGAIIESCSICGVEMSRIVIPRINKITLSASKYVYNGKAKTPAVTVKDTKGNKLVKGTDYTVQYKNSAGKVVAKPKAVGQYRAIVTFKGNYSGTVTKYFTINPKATAITKLTKGKKQFTVKWTKRTAQVTGYEIQYSTTKAFTKKTTKTVKVKTYKTNTKTIKNLKAKKKYWVKVRTYKVVNGKTFYSTWTNAKPVTTK